MHTLGLKLDPECCGRQLPPPSNRILSTITAQKLNLVLHKIVGHALPFFFNSLIKTLEIKTNKKVIGSNII